MAPFFYTCTEVEATALDTWVNKSGGVTISGDLRNLAEIGCPGAAEVPDDTIVVIWEAATGIWVFDSLNYRGTFA